MANYQLNVAIMRAINSGAYFTKVDEQKLTNDDRELRELNQEQFNQRMSKFDSPNNIKGIMITTQGIYVETYNGYGVIDKADGKPKRQGIRIKHDKQTNKQFQEAIRNQDTRIILNNNWMFQPVIQNIKYIYFDEQLKYIANREFKSTQDILKVLNNIVLNAPGQKGQPTRQKFQKLKHIAYVPGLGVILGNKDGFQRLLQLTQQNKEELWLDKYCQAANKPKAELDLERLNSWGKCGITQARSEVYLYDKAFIDEKASQEREELEAQRQQQKEKEKQVEKDGYGIPGVIETKESYGDIIENYLIKPVIEGYKYLLGIGYSGPRSNDGMLANKVGQVYLGQQGQIVLPQKQGIIKDADLYQKIQSALNNQGIHTKAFTNSQADATKLQIKDSISYYSSLLETNREELKEFNYALGLRLIKGYLVNCKITKEYSQENISNTSIINWTGMAEYLRAYLMDLCAVLLVKNNIVNIEASEQDLMNSDEVGQVTEYCQELRKVFCYGIYTQKQYSLDEKRELIQTDIRICLPVTVNIERFFDDLQSCLPVKLDKISSKPVERNSIYNLFAIKVCYNEDPTKGMIQATKALESLKEKNQKPSWSKALLGEKDDGTPFFWKDFMGSNNQPYKRAYSIYAGQRQGKGILTNTLVANAIQNGYKVFFVDGKPDTGITIGNLAWKKGKEAFVFDGMRQGYSLHQSGQLEEYSYGMRKDREQLYDIGQIPKELNVEIPSDLVDKQGLQTNSFGELLTTTTVYYKCVELIFKIIEYRAQGNRGPAEEDWAIFIIDECAKMAERENFIRKQFFEYVKSTGAKHNNGIPYKPLGKDESKVVWNEALQFIANWLKWLDGIASMAQTAQTMSLGNQQQNIFFIFQGSKWIGQYSDTLMSKGLMRLSTTKVLGHDAIEHGAPSNFGNTQTKNAYEWAKYISKPMHWVITKDQDVSGCDDSKVYKFIPYSLWGNTRGQMLNGEPDDFRNMQYYIREVEKAFGIDAAEVLNSAYVYAEEFVKTVSNKRSLKEYIYGLRFLTGASNQAQQEQDTKEHQAQQIQEKDTYIQEQDNKEHQAQQIQDDYGMYFEEPAYQQNTAYQQADIAKFQDKQYSGRSYQLDKNGEINLYKNRNTEVCTDNTAIKVGSTQSLMISYLKDKLNSINPATLANNAKSRLEYTAYSLMAGGALINAIASQAGGYRNVKQLRIIQNQIWVNGKLLLTSQDLQAPNGVFNVQRILSFKKLFKSFKSIVNLKIDSEMWEELKYEFSEDGDDRIKNLFSKNRSLEVIEVESLLDKKAFKITREDSARFVCKDSRMDKLEKALNSKKKNYKDIENQRRQKKQSLRERTRAAIADSKQEMWGSPVKKALTITTAAATVGFLGLTAGPLAFVGLQIAQKIWKSKHKNNR